ncbi:MAG: dihydrodipicolinate synthase family protein [Blautia sp.]|uniref:dihydrodipicolinate synthase family protein n=1 Tax=Blautia sp. TaxID=1955243 RepID=UPI0039965806
MAKEIASGVWPVMITPFTEDNRIDYDGVLKIIEWYDKMGVDGIFAMCQSSEMFELTPQERLELIRFVVEHTPKHIGIIASGHCAEKVEDQIREAQAAIDAGVGSYVFISNQFAKEDENEDVAKQNIEYLLDHIEAESFGIYECPYPYKRLVSPELLKWCAETGKFTFLKDTCCDVDQLHAKVEAVKGTPMKIFNANGATLLESLKMGCHGYSGVMANFHPDLYVWLCRNFEKEPERAEIMMNYLGAASTFECQVYPCNSKYHMKLEGVNITTKSRRQDDALLTPNRLLEVEQFHAHTEYFRKTFFGK